ncbi:unnamed protein product [Mytilus edulis]|uniref:Uncharacterized protein n=1 Tax=Mytilus edulis TaxID=6550 RepID=A0A8S3RN25_MYTED|nr:unnamed protein product [Mytilus edulis]
MTEYENYFLLLCDRYSARRNELRQELTSVNFDSQEEALNELIRPDMDTRQLGDNVSIYPTECDDTEVSNSQNSHSDNFSEPRKVPFSEEQQPRKVMTSKNTTSQSVCRTSSGVTNIRSNKNSNGATRNNSIPVMSVDPVNIIASENSSESSKDNQNRYRPRPTRTENICQCNTSNKKPNDTETDAKPSSENSAPIGKIDFPQSATDGFTFDSSKEEEEMQCYENSILRPKDHFNQPLTPKHLLDTVIVYAKSDYKLALAYVRYLRSIASANDMSDIQIKLYTSEDFPNNDVKVVKEVVNRSMRIIMLLSADFTNEMSLSFIKDETIGMIALQELPSQEHMSSSYTTMINRQRNCLRVVHTVAKKERYYRTPAGLASLRPFEFFRDNKNQKYEDDIIFKFLKSAREDRLSHMEQLNQQQSLANPHISQESENVQQVRFQVVTKKSRPQVVTNSRDGSNTQQLDNLSFATSGFVSNPSPEPVAMSNTLKNVPSSKTITVDTNPMKHDSYNSKLPMPNKSENSDPAKTSPIQKDDIGLFGQGDEEEDKYVDSCQVDLDKVPVQSTQGQQNVIRKDKMKDANLESLGDIRENKISYSCPSGRSGIRTGANPEYGEYFRETLPGKHQQVKQPAGYSPQSIHYHKHYHLADQSKFKRKDVETDSGHGSLGSIINIKSNTVVLGDANRVNYTQKVRETNKNESTNDDAINNESKQRGDTLPEKLTMKETSASYKSQPEVSLNILSPSSDQRKMVDDESLDNNSDEDNSNIEPESQCIKSGETFDSGVDLTQSVTSNCTDQNETENVTIVKENFTNEKEESGPDEDNKSVEIYDDCYNVFQCLDCVSVNDC